MHGSITDAILHRRAEQFCHNKLLYNCLPKGLEDYNTYDQITISLGQHCMMHGSITDNWSGRTGPLYIRWNVQWSWAVSTESGTHDAAIGLSSSVDERSVFRPLILQASLQWTRRYLLVSRRACRHPSPSPTGLIMPPPLPYAQCCAVGYECASSHSTNVLARYCSVL